MDPQGPARRTLIRASAWSVPVIAVAATAPAFAGSPLGAALLFDTANLYGADWSGSRPTRLESNVQVQNSWYSGAPTITNLVLTVSYPQSAVSGANATKVSGAGWSVRKDVLPSGSPGALRWVYRFDWVGSAAPGGGTGTFIYRVPIKAPYPAGADVVASFTATASGGTVLASSSHTLPS